MHGEMRNIYIILFRKPEWCRHTWDGNIKMELTWMECETVDWIHQPFGRDIIWALVCIA